MNIKGIMIRGMKSFLTVSILLAVSVVMLVGCGGAGPEPGFDVTGVWTEQGGGSTLEFTEGTGYMLIFEPPLSDGTTKFGGESYARVDNSHLTFTILMGRAPLEIIEVEAIIDSSHVLRFKLDGKSYRFTKTGE